MYVCIYVYVYMYVYTLYIHICLFIDREREREIIEREVCKNSLVSPPRSGLPSAGGPREAPGPRVHGLTISNIIAIDTVKLIHKYSYALIITISNIISI